MASAKFYGTGRRKKSIARVYLVPGTGKITINKRDIDEYFGLETLKVVVRQPLVATETEGKFDVLVNVHGGGFTGQAGAIRHGVARALLQADNEYRPVLKSAGFLTRDPRMKERKKYGLKAARRAPSVQQEIIFGTRIYVQILVLQGFVELSDVVKSGGIYSVRNAFATRLQQKYLKNIGHFSVIDTGECPFCYADFVSAVTLSSFSKVLLIASTRTCISK